MTNFAKIAKNNKFNKILVIEKDETKKRPEMSANMSKIAKVTRFFMLDKNTHEKYLKYRKNTKCNKIPDLQRKEAKKGPEMSPNIAKIAKLTKIFLATIPDKTT